MKPSRISGMVLMTLIGALCACGASDLEGPKTPSTGQAFEGVQCNAVRPQTEPDLMAWDPGSRSNLTRLRREGLVAVRYEAKGCNVELELLSNCIGGGASYGFSPYSANEHKLARNATELYAQLPVGAARLSGALKGNRALRTDYMMAGVYALPSGTSVSADDLRGPDCARATHVVSAVYVGAFAMGAGETRSVEGGVSLLGAGGGGKRNAEVEVLSDEGDADACRTSQQSAAASDRCAVPLRIGLLGLARSGAPRPPGEVARTKSSDRDSDGDGIVDARDACPLDPEDKDGYLDDDGCPEPDNDADGVLDIDDKCPNLPEDHDGFEDDDGCPDPDNDRDSVADVDDMCPNEPGPPGGAMAGCPIGKGRTK